MRKVDSNYYKTDQEKKSLKCLKTVKKRQNERKKLAM